MPVAVAARVLRKARLVSSSGVAVTAAAITLPTPRRSEATPLAVAVTILIIALIAVMAAVPNTVTERSIAITRRIVAVPETVAAMLRDSARKMFSSADAVVVNVFPTTRRSVTVPLPKAESALAIV